MEIIHLSYSLMVLNFLSLFPVFFLFLEEPSYVNPIKPIFKKVSRRKFNILSKFFLIFQQNN